MKQLVQDRGSGRLEVLDVPEPAVPRRGVLVRTAFSVVSPGTERAALELASGSLLRAARRRPDVVRRVVDSARREGARATWERVQGVRRQPLAPGYSSAGTVLAVGPDAVPRFSPGDRVACSGAGHAVHAELAGVPASLAVAVPESVPLEAAAFASLGAIALHAVRQAEPTLGERFAVVGLGAIGLLAVQVLRASGCRVLGLDLDRRRAELASKLGAEVVAAGGTDEQVERALSWTGGLGVDGVLVTAASTDDAPMVAAARSCRDRARVVAVGLVPFGLPRELAFERELELRISRSTGPGRFDPDFEERGRDLPAGHVRWTETRNLEAVVRLLEDGSLTPLPLATRREPLEDAPRAYEALLGEDVEERPLTILLEHGSAAAPEQVSVAPVSARPATPTGEAAVSRRTPPRGAAVGVGLVGAGAFVRSTLGPVLAGARGVSLRWVIAEHGLSARSAAQRFGFDEAGTDLERLLGDESVHLAVIATRHDSHAELAARALRRGLSCLVEKPLALSHEELARVADVAGDAPGLLAVGFNRRFAPAIRELREVFEGRGPLAVSCRVNAGRLPAGHWTADPETGGGRVLGEACHFIDLVSALAGDPGIRAVQSLRARSEAPGEAVIQLELEDGTLGQVLYAGGGASRLPKERIEVHGGGASAVLDDFRRVEVFTGRRRRSMRLPGKGHAEQLAAVVDAVADPAAVPVPLRVVLEVSRAALLAAGLPSARETDGASCPSEAGRGSSAGGS